MNIKKTLLGKLLIPIIIVMVVIFAIYRWKVEDYHVIDYDFYQDGTTLYAFLIEGEGIEKHNKINGKEYHCGTRFMVFKKSLEDIVPS